MNIKKTCLAIVGSTIGLAIAAGMFGMYRGDLNPDTVKNEYSSGSNKINVPNTLVEILRAVQNEKPTNDDWHWDEDEQKLVPDDSEADESEDTGTDEDADTGKTETPQENFGQSSGYWTAKINASAQRGENNMMEARNYDGKEYYIEHQSSAGPWSNYKSTGGSKVGSAGCMLYASAIAISNYTGKLVTVKDVIKGMGYSVAYTSGKYTGGSNPLPYVGQHAPEVTWQKALAVGGLSGTEVNTANADNAIKSGKMVMVHENSGSPILSSSGQHWYVIAGYKSGKYLVLSSNTSKSGWLAEGTVKSSLNTSNHNIVIE